MGAYANVKLYYSDATNPTDAEIAAGTDFTVRMKAGDSAYEVIRELEALISNHNTWGPALDQKITNQRNTLQWMIKTRPGAGHYVQVEFNSNLARLLGYRYAKIKHHLAIKAPGTLERTRYKNFIGRTRELLPVDDLLHPPIGLLYTNIVERSPVGSEMAPILEIIPISALTRERDRARAQEMYKPESLQFRNPDRSEVSEIRFQLCQPNGAPIDFKSVSQRALETTGGAMVEIKMRPRRQIRRPADDTPNKWRGDWQRDRINQLLK
jgi:hypothetical protein